MSKSTLVLFTLHYPYSKVSETFLESEIDVLSKRFQKIIIIPWKRENDETKKIPVNAVVSNILLDFQYDRNYLRLYSKHLKYCPFFLKIYLYTLINERVNLPYLKYAYFLYNLANAFERAIVLKKFIIGNDLGNAIFYDYWFENSTLSLSILKDQGVIKQVYSRSHGFDAFDERWTCGAVPFRSYKILHNERHFAISNYAQSYFVKRLPKKLRSKITVSYLGVQEQKIVESREDVRSKEKYIIVSSANLFDFKRVHLMPQLLNSIDLNITWYHFGDGPLKNDLLLNAEKLSNKVEFNFMGHVAHEQLIEFYRKESIDLFISLSIKEGLPVSMMEALSFGIPLVGYDVFGIPEIVNKTTGLLFDVEESFDAMALQIRELLLKDTINRNDMGAFFNRKFNAEVNYHELANTMLNSDAL